MTVAAYMECVLYDPRCGYYARAPRRSGRAGDFFTSVDVGALFGELLEIQIAEMADLLARTGPVDLVEVGASDGRLAADILHAARHRDPAFHDRLRLHLVEASATARDAQRTTLSDVDQSRWSSSPELPASFEGVLFANEWLDALPVHQVVMRHDGLREVYVTVDAQARLSLCEQAPSTPALAQYLDAVGTSLEPGWRTEVNLQAIERVREVASRLARGFLILIDYGHEARELHSVTHAAGTLTTFAGHRGEGAEGPGSPAWLLTPGARDITAHVDFTGLRRTVEAEGLETIALLDQTYFLLGLLPPHLPVSQTRALKTLIMPGGLGSTMKVFIAAKNIGRAELKGCSYRVRVT
jgi:SAM-dependent MidA family methyltransferase